MWGGDGLGRFYDKPIPDEAIGEAWLVSDHPHHTSIVNRGPLSGRSLHELMCDDAASILGSRTQLTVHGRFPLLLKILDAQRDLSIQVHPDTQLATELGENDIGKDEMWHVLHAKPDTVLYCGLEGDMPPITFESTVHQNQIAEYLNTIPAHAGQSVFVPAGTIHSIGKGCILAEIQQNSDLTYRIDDWDRVQADGTPRELHREKAFKAVRLPNTPPYVASSYTHCSRDRKTTIHLLAACEHFASEEICLDGSYHEAERGDTFHLFLGKTGTTTVSTLDDEVRLFPGQAALVPAQAQGLCLEGESRVLHYYVPDLADTIVAPLSAAGYSAADIKRLIHP